MDGKQLYLKPEEAKFISMAVVGTVERLKESSQDQTIPWNPESRKDLKDMIAAGTSLTIKMEKLGFDMRPLPDIIPGEENDYLTKPS